MFQYLAPDRFRIDYLQPTARTIVYNPQECIEFVPTLSKAVRTSFADSNTELKTEIRQAVLSRVAIHGLRAGRLMPLVENMTRIYTNSANQIVIQGKAPPFSIHIDPAMKVIVRTEIRKANGDLKIRTRSSRFKNVTMDIWIPRKIEVTRPSEQGRVTEITTLSNLRCNSEPSPGLFQIELSPEVKIHNRQTE